MPTVSRFAALLTFALALCLSSCDSKSTGNAGPFFIDAGPRDIAGDTGTSADVAADTAAPPDGGAPDAPATDAPADAPASDAPSGDTAPTDTASADAADTGSPIDAANPDLPRLDALDALDALDVLPTVDTGADTRDATGG